MDPLVKPEDDEIFGEDDELEGSEGDDKLDPPIKSEDDELVGQPSLEFSFLINFCTSS